MNVNSKISIVSPILLALIF